MTWQAVIPQLIRGLIGDFDSPPEYSDGRLEELSIYAAHLLLNEVTFDTTYTVSILTLEITPDPSTDTGFVNLVALKASLIVLMNEVKVAANQSISVTDGPAKIQLVDVYKAKKELYDALIKAYEKSKLNHQLGNQNPGQAIITPTTIETYGPYPFS